MLRSVFSPAPTSSHHSLFQQGFTLIELLIVIGLFALLTGGAAVNYRAFYQRQQVLQSAKNVQEAMRSAQKKARVGQKPSACATLEGYNVNAGTNSTEISIRALCTPNTYVTVTTIPLVGNARLVSALNTTFQVITGGVLNPGTVQLRYGSYTYAFDVNVGGEITEGSFQ